MQAPTTNLPSFKPLPRAIDILNSKRQMLEWSGIDAATWASYVRDPSLAAAIAAADHPELYQRLARPEVQNFCLRQDVPFELRAAAALGWGRAGGKGYAHAPALWGARHAWLPLLERLPHLSREEAFREFRTLRRQGQLPGLGPAYFTKLIFFFGCGTGYILDKWLAASVQVLNAAHWTFEPDGLPVFTWRSSNFPKLNHQRTMVVDQVTAEEYERFCEILEDLAPLLRLADGDAVEQLLFSSSTWRAFVRQHCLTITTSTRNKANKHGAAGCA
ncbi:hypothetical protein LH704_21075 [Burkholderia cenocepacia]|uniref:8-oxoguanine DNA glycosylase OGG fold protein n=1 Tax=Burkholderia cenocepacia TaxID=95486 RepID=UPI001F3820AD|nr:hypothetical protein [Burkholderia cenocepacia]MCF1369271.1 hypothetical protein [Burkholderia cenocepacia]MCF1386698.1 hypothetical protein [Burkholderia cenocepacia]